MTSDKLSIYQRIKEAIQPDGTLPADFVLRQQPEIGMKFADGAMDGTIRYHMGPTKNPDISGLTVVLDLASKERYNDAVNALLTHFMNGGVMLPVMDALQDWVYDHPEDLVPEKIGVFCRSLLTQSQEPEAIKFALTILELLDQDIDDDLKQVVATLAVSEELTLFCLFFLGLADDANDQFFSLAKRLRGWGKIHAVSMLHPESAEQANWLLNEGWKNEISPEYSAMTVIKRAKLLQLLSAEKIDKNLFGLASTLISASLGDSVIAGAGMAKYKNAGPLLEAYIGHAAALAESLEDYGVVFDISDFADSHTDLPGAEKIGDAASDIMETESCRQTIKRAMSKGEGLYLAKSLGMDYAEATMEALRNDWRNSYDLIDLLLPEKLYVNEIVDLFQTKLDLDEMATGAENELGNDPSFADYGILSYVVQGLQQVPGKGDKLIVSALLSPVIGCRNIALTTIDKWRKTDYQLSAGIVNALEELKATEVDEKTKKRLESF